MDTPQNVEIQVDMPSQPVAKSYGKWTSPITPEMIVEGATHFETLQVDGDVVYWNERRAEEKGRYALMRRHPNGAIEEVLPSDYNVRSCVHEYGGGAFNVDRDRIVFTHFGDHRTYFLAAGKEPRAITPEPKKNWHVRFADFVFSEKGILAIGEEHQAGKEAENFIALIDPEKAEYVKLVTGHDFYASPAISNDGKKIAYVAWNHPNMPWDDTQLWVATLGANGVTDQVKVAGEASEAIFQPAWSDRGELYFVSDRTNWWNLYRWDGQDVENICPMEAEMGMPHWIFGFSTWGQWKEKIFVTYTKMGRWYLGLIDPATKTLQEISREGVEYEQIRVGSNFAVFIEGFAKDPRSIQGIDLSSMESFEIKESDRRQVDPGYLSEPQHIEIPTSEGQVAYGIFYPPVNKDFIGESGEKPPLLVKIHGGPTSQAKMSFALKHQYWTSRGFGVLDVNYRGSTGYGRQFRNALKDNWGIYDVEDCVHGAMALAEKGLVDPNKLFITGGSAGGYTVLAALTFKDVFRGGASHFGVADIEVLAEETHKFESRYMDQLLGEYPKMKQRWRERSPIHAAKNLNSPVIFFQGTEDTIVPPNQAEMMYKAVKANGVLTDLILYEGEQHGFRKSETIVDTLNRELAFYLKVLEDEKKQ